MGSSWSLMGSGSRGCASTSPHRHAATSAHRPASETGCTTVNGAKMGVEAQPDLSRTLNPKALHRVEALLRVAADRSTSLSAVRPQSAKPQRAIGRMQGATSDAERRTALDDKALAHIREDLMNSLPHTLTWPGPGHQESSHRGSASGAAGRRARLHDSPSRNPVAERRFPGAASTRSKDEPKVLKCQGSRKSRFRRE